MEAAYFWIIWKDTPLKCYPFKVGWRHKRWNLKLEWHVEMCGDEVLECCSADCRVHPLMPWLIIHEILPRYWKQFFPQIMCYRNMKDAGKSNEGSMVVMVKRRARIAKFLNNYQVGANRILGVAFALVSWGCICFQSHLSPLMCPFPLCVWPPACCVIFLPFL